MRVGPDLSIRNVAPFFFATSTATLAISSTIRVLKVWKRCWRVEQNSFVQNTRTTLHQGLKGLEALLEGGAGVLNERVLLTALLLDLVVLLLRLPLRLGLGLGRRSRALGLLVKLLELLHQRVALLGDLGQLLLGLRLVSLQLRLLLLGLVVAVEELGHIHDEDLGGRLGVCRQHGEGYGRDGEDGLNGFLHGLFRSE